jgi:hypothetical protein
VSPGSQTNRAFQFKLTLHGRKQGNGGTRGLVGQLQLGLLSRHRQLGGFFFETALCLPHCRIMRHLTFHVSDLNLESTRMNEVVLDDHEVRTFTQILAQDLAQNVPEIRHQGCLRGPL